MDLSARERASAGHGAGRAAAQAVFELDFRAKHGIRHVSRVSDRKLARVVKNCRDLPGCELLQYIDEAGEPHCIDSADVNEYLRGIAGHDVTAKDFRTWAATNLAVLALADQEQEPPTKKAQVEAIRQVAKRLGNTPAICRKCYIHPGVLEGYLNGSLRKTLAALGQEEQPTEMWRVERIVMRFLAQDAGTASNATVRRG